MSRIKIGEYYTYLYINKSSQRWALLEPTWILKNRDKGFASVWRSYAFRVPKDKMLPLLKSEIIQMWNCEINILQFAYDNVYIVKY